MKIYLSRFIKVVLIAVMALPLPLYAEAWPPLRLPDPLTPDWVVKQVLTRYPEIHAKHRAYLAALERAPQARAWDDPTVGVMIDRWSTRRFNGGGASDADKMVELSQKLPAYGRRALKAQVAEREADLVFIDGVEHHLELQWQALQAFYDYQLAYTRVELLEDQRRLWEAYTPAVKARTHLGANSPRDLALEEGRINTLLLKYTQDRRAAQFRLNTLVSRAVDAPLTRPALGTLSNLPPNEHAAAKEALRRAPAMRMVGAQLARSEAALALAHKTATPEVAVFGRYTFAGEPGLDDSVRLGFNFTLPLGSSGKEDRAVAEATHELGRWQEERTARSAEVVRDVLILHNQARSQRDAYRYYEQDILPRTQQLLSATLATYQSNRSNVLQLLDAQKAVLDTQLEALEMRVSYDRTLADLARAIGQLPEYAEQMMNENPLNSPRDRHEK